MSEAKRCYNCGKVETPEVLENEGEFQEMPVENGMTLYQCQVCIDDDADFDDATVEV